MQLKKIKLSGFKSFVDPTIVLLPSNLVAVVGPNGCGKSNIIDAVCWVMGETSAKYLRGESLADVIFNGSGTRKPIGQASVELVFDNQDSTLGGEYASYAEISIRRLLTREGDSVYFLNGTRCRRRDIIDIFLGTGLGPRSYSIIGQNMISRIIEARPEEMRVYLEEAAGISKYKERRRETENRIHHTKDNLARLNDVCVELEKQLNSLKRQASAAERFKILKQEERVKRAEWQALQWRQLDARLVEHSLNIQQHETGLEARQAELSTLNLSTDQKKTEQHEANEIFQEIQKNYYAAGNEIAHIEQEIRYHQERLKQWQADLLKTDEDWKTLNQQIDDLTDEQEELLKDLSLLEPLRQAKEEEASVQTKALTHAEENMQHWQSQWDGFHQQHAKSQQTAEVEQTRIQHLEQKIIALKQRQAVLIQEESEMDFISLEHDISLLDQKVLEILNLVKARDAELSTIHSAIHAQQKVQQTLMADLDKSRDELQQERGRQVSLEALQQTALGQKDNNVIQWLTKHQLDKLPRLAQEIEVESGWEHAVEKVLGSVLQAVCVNTLNDVTSFVNEFKSGTLCVFSTSPSSMSAKVVKNSLLNKIKSPWALDTMLSGIYIAENLQEALTLASSLEPHESVITPEGIWINRSWLRISHEENPAAGVFQREQELKQTASHIQKLLETQNTLEQQLVESRQQLSALEKQREDLQKTMQQIHIQSAEARAQQQTKKDRLQEMRARCDRYRQEQEDIGHQLESGQTDLNEARTLWQEAMQQLETHTKQRNDLLAARDHLKNELQTIRLQAQTTKEEAHQFEIRLQTTRSQENSLKQSILRMQSQLKTLLERKTHLQNELESASSSEHLEKQLAEALSQRLTIEETLNTAKNRLSQIDHTLKEMDQRRHVTETEAAKTRDILQTLRIEWQGIKVKAEAFVEQIKESGFQLEDILQSLPDTAVLLELQAELEQITLKITRLGAINLVAIEEYATCLERKEYLDKQVNDLQEGLTTLENAIAKIDKETRTRFKETFDKVNDRFQELFPTIFGGGRAYLELTGENLLDAGITVMACPPGKRNSTIHLLSGGEKALTAIALVFSIFHLNPAPFCMLDEVDAPLDDVNVGRYCQLVKTMSEKTQFIFISHNKLAIEMAEHLMGVTMHEPGVSRLVSVSVQEAMSLAGA